MSGSMPPNPPMAVSKEQSNEQEQSVRAARSPLSPMVEYSSAHSAMDCWVTHSMLPSSLFFSEWCCSGRQQGAACSACRSKVLRRAGAGCIMLRMQVQVRGEGCAMLKCWQRACARHLGATRCCKAACGPRLTTGMRLNWHVMARQPTEMTVKTVVKMSNSPPPPMVAVLGRIRTAAALPCKPPGCATQRQRGPWPGPQC